MTTKNKPQRETAKLCSIKELLEGTYVVQEGWNPNYVRTENRKLSRVNMMGLIVDKSSPFQFLFDDGTGTISVVDFNNKEKTAHLKIGEPVLIVGRPRQSQNQIFISCEIATANQVKKHPLWLVQRKEELKKHQAVQEKEEPLTEAQLQESFKTPEVPKNVSVELTAEAIEDFIRKKDDEHGCLIEDIISYFGDEADDIILTMLSMGDVFEIKPGRLKLLE